MDALTPVIVNRQPDPEEALRVMTPIVLRQTGIVVWRVICGLLGVAMLAFAAITFFSSTPDYVFGTFFLAFGVTLLIAPPFSVRRMVKRRIVDELNRAGGARGSLTISEAGIDVQGAHSNAHFDWSALTEARRIPEGILFRIGRIWAYVAVREFDSDPDFERALALFRSGLGAKFAG